MQRRGVGIARRRLERDLEIWETKFEQIEHAIFDILRCDAFRISQSRRNSSATLERSGTGRRVDPDAGQGPATVACA